MIVGIDEVGRGPWAGPLVFGAVVLGEHSIVGLTDSKKLSKKRREVLAKQIHKQAKSVGLGWVSAKEIDTIGLGKALALGCQRALEQINAPYSQIILDGTVNLLKDTGKGPYVTTMAKADLLVPSVSAASIVAKVARDEFMTKQDDVYPGYSFGAHAGYGTAKHIRAINQFGVTPLHRLSFAPLAKYQTAGPAVRSAPKNFSDKPKTFLGAAPPNVTRTGVIGGRGEDSAVAYLVRNGFKILERNWRVKAGEVDIIAEKNGIVHFVEVKYRKNHDQGGGIAAITPTKLKHMERAARLWMQRFGDRHARLSVVEVTGEDYEVTQFLEQVRA